MNKKALIYEFNMTAPEKWVSLFGKTYRGELLEKIIRGSKSGNIFIQSQRFIIHEGSNISVSFKNYYSGSRYVDFRVIVTAKTFTDADEKSIEKRINTFFKAVDEKIDQLYTLKEDMNLLKQMEED